MFSVQHNDNIVARGITYAFSMVNGKPFPDLCGRWRAGGGINVPINLETSTTTYKAMEIEKLLRLVGLLCSVESNMCEFCKTGKGGMALCNQQSE